MKYLFLLAVPVLIFGHGDEVHKEKKEPKQKQEIKDAQKEIYSQINEQYIKNIKPIFEVKCFDCHSDKTVYPWYFKLPLVSTLIKKDIAEAKEHLDFSNDFPFISHETPIKDLVSILDVFEEKSMPPFRYTIMHSESKITNKDIKIVKEWVDNSLEKLNYNEQK